MRMYALASLEGDGDNGDMDRVGYSIFRPQFDGAFDSRLSVSV
jgi:hypothetical protein